MRCGNCKENHDTADDVRKCYGASVKFRPLSTVHDGKNGQYELLQKLLAEREMTPLPPYMDVAKIVSIRDAAKMISYLIDSVPRTTVETDTLAGLDVPAGHYAVKSLTGNNDLDFFRVYRPAKGEWACRIFIYRVIGGRADSRVRGSTAREALKAIIDAGPGNAAQLYGQTLGRCSECNRHLTDETSRQLGIGPDCRSK